MPRSDGKCEIKKVREIRSDYLIFPVRELQAQLKQARKEARLPMSHYLGQYDHSISNGLSVTQLNQLRELHCVEEGCYKLIIFYICIA